MLLNYTYYGLTIFTTKNLAVWDNCVASKQASKQASILVYNKIFSSERAAAIVAMGFIPCKQ